MNCLVDVRQLKKPENHENQTHVVFFINLNINYEVDYFPHHLHLNLKFRKWPSFEIHPVLLLEDTQLRHTVSDYLSQSLIPDSQFDSIAETLCFKAKSIASHPRNSGFNFIPISISIRAVWLQEFNLEAKLAWERLIPGGGRISANLPATEMSVLQLETVFYDGGVEKKEEDEQCPICLKEFEIGKEIKRMACFHLYHGECIGKWLQNGHVCPSCRFPMPICKVVEGNFAFFRRKDCERRVAAVAGGRIRMGARMSTRPHVYV